MLKKRSLNIANVRGIKYNYTIKRKGNPMQINSELIIAEMSSDCTCDTYNEETDEYEPSETCYGDCYEIQKDDVDYVIGEWQKLNEIEEDDFIIINGRGMTWQNLEGSAKTTLDNLSSILTINGDFRITWTLHEETKKLTARRGSHDEPMGANFEIDFIKTLPCNVCGELINAEIHAEELGMCLDCSNAYFTHEDEEPVDL
jgi:hypothetical protein